MDQSISVMAKAGCPLIILFWTCQPDLYVMPVSFCCSPVFVIANTLVTAEKHLTAPTNYNLRVVEVRLAAALLAKKLELVHDQPLITLREVHDYYCKSKGLEIADLGYNSFRHIDILAALLEEVETFIGKKPYSKEEIASELGMSVEGMEAHFVGSIVIRAEGFELYKRANHVISEARRVYMFMGVAEYFEEGPQAIPLESWTRPEPCEITESWKKNRLQVL